MTCIRKMDQKDEIIPQDAKWLILKNESEREKLTL